jgi:hypothetical protein
VFWKRAQDLTAEHLPKEAIPMPEFLSRVAKNLNLEKGPALGSFVLRDDKTITEFCKQTGMFIWADHTGIKTESGPTPHQGESLLLLGLARPLPKSRAHADHQRGLMADVSPVWVNTELLKTLNSLVRDDNNGIRRVSSWPIERTFVYLDVSDFSKEYAGRQVFIINSIVHIVGEPDHWDISDGLIAKKGLEAQICIGDGYIFVFKDALNATVFAGYLAGLIELLAATDKLYVDFHFRIGVHAGPVYSFWDPGRNDWNYIGEGINGGKRVLSAIGKNTDDVVFVSGAVRRILTAANVGKVEASRILKCLHNRGRKADKHGNLWRVYELNHTDLNYHELGLSGLESRRS